jgi:hypothetical protein
MVGAVAKGGKSIFGPPRQRSASPMARNVARPDPVPEIGPAIAQRVG